MKTALDVLLQGEGQFTEYKSAYDRSRSMPVNRSKKTLARDLAICLAEFANADGGTLILGVEDNGTLSGVPLTEHEISEIRTMARQSWKQAVPYTVEWARKDDKTLVVFEVAPQADIFVLTDGRAPYRVNDQTLWLSPDEVRALKHTKVNTLFERTLVAGITMENLDPELLSRFRSGVGAPLTWPDEEVLCQHDLAARNGDGVRLTLAACLLFGKPPMVRFHERCGINFRRFAGTQLLHGDQNNEVLDRTIEQPLPILIEQTFALLSDQIRTSTKLRGLFFEERPEYPTFAWQEAVVNAVVHRTYALRGNEIEIRMFDDRIEVQSPGLPPEPVTIEELRQRQPVHASRNPRLMRALKAFRYVRERGEGLPRMFAAMEASVLPPPEISSAGQFFYVILRNTPIFDQTTMEWLGTFAPEQMTPAQRRILAHAYQSGRGYFVLSDYAQVNHVDKDTAKREIKAMLDSGVIEIIGAKKGAKYYPRLQGGSDLEKLRDYFARHPSLTNIEYRRLVGVESPVSASNQLRRLVEKGLLHKQGKQRGTKYFPSEELLKAK